MKPIHINFSDPKMIYRLKNGGGKKQAIAKAVGLKNLKNPYVLDATAGMGRDGFVLASLGCRVQMIERNGQVASALQHALTRAALDHSISEIAERISLHIGDAKDFLQEMADIPDVIYIDPMFPERTKSALVKKEMRLFKEIVGADDDAEELLQCAIGKAKHRIVVKRPRHAGFLGDIQPSFSLEGKANRFDIIVSC